MSPTALPLAARFALWFSAWATGTASLDDARDAIVDEDAAHDVTGLPGTTGSRPLIVALGLLRGLGATGAGITLPAPGDPVGLAGPAAFNHEVLEVGEGVVLRDAELGLVPRRAGAGVVWTAHPAVSRRQLPDLGEAEGGLRRALAQASTLLADLDVAHWRPEVADELMALRRPADFAFPGATVAPAVRVASLATRCRRIVDLALGDDGGAVTAREADARRGALAPLDAAARRGLVAACSSETWPPPSSYDR